MFTGNVTLMLLSNRTMGLEVHINEKLNGESWDFIIHRLGMNYMKASRGKARKSYFYINLSKLEKKDAEWLIKFWASRIEDADSKELLHEYRYASKLSAKKFDELYALAGEEA